MANTSADLADYENQLNVQTQAQKLSLLREAYRINDGEPVKLEGAEKQAVIDEFKTSFHINGDSLNISQVSVDDPKIFDLITKKYISESERTANGKYAYIQDYFLDATMNPNKDQKYADKLKTVDMHLLVQKVMKDNRHELKLNKF